MKNFISRYKIPIMIISIIILFAIIDTYSGVSNDKYDSLVSENNKLSYDLQSKEDMITELNNTIDSLNSKIDELKKKYESNTDVSSSIDEKTSNSDKSNTLNSNTNPLIPLVSYEDILSTDYNTYVYIDGVIDNYNKNDSTGSITFDMWYPYKNSYIRDSLYVVHDDNELYDSISKLSSGDSIRLETRIYEDSSFGISSTRSIQTIESISSLKKIENTFKKQSKKEEFTSLLRKPDSYFGSNLTFKGDVFQIIEQTDETIELLLDIGNNQYIHVNYYFRDGDSRILEKDFITIYGYFYKLFSYTSLLGDSKEIPELSAVYLDPN